MSQLNGADKRDATAGKTTLPLIGFDTKKRPSYTPVADWVPPTAQELPIGAYQVPRSKRIAQVLIAVLSCFFGAGIVFGFAALKPVLILEGVYRDLCTERELKAKVRVCYEQQIRLNFMFTLAAVATNVAALPVGAILDRFGPRICGFIGSAFLTIGCLLMAFAEDIPIDGYMSGYLFLALGGPFIFISSFQLSNTFPRRSGLILGLLTGAFDTSSAIFLFYRLSYTASGGENGLKQFFIIYLIVPIFILLVQMFVMPKVGYKTLSELAAHAGDTAHDEHDSDAEIDSDTERERIQEDRRSRRETAISDITALLDPVENEDEDKKETAKKFKSGVWGALHGLSAWQQIRSYWWLLIALFTMQQMLRINYFIATIRSQYTYMMDASKGEAINHFFDVALPLGGVIAIPFIGIILDNLSTPLALLILVSTATIIGVFGLLPYIWAAYINVLLFVLYRPLYYTTVSDYSAKVFGFNTFGKTYGLIFAVSGVFNLVANPLDRATNETYGGDPFWVNLILLCCGAAVGAVLVSYVWIRSYNVSGERLEAEAEGAEEFLVPNADPRAREDYQNGYGTNH